MSTSFCKITLKPLKSDSEKQSGYSRTGLKQMFGTGQVDPVLSMSRSDLMQGFRASRNRMSISGAQPKRSAVLSGKVISLTDTGGQFIVKPSPEEYPHLAEVEHACMAMSGQLSARGRLTIADNGLFPLNNGELVYITRRFDRLPDGTKLQQEQMDAAMGVGGKYDGNVSYERIGRFIGETVTVPLPALMAFYEQVLVSFLLGNDDLHIRNLGILVDNVTGKATGLTPAYDIVASSLYTEGGSFMALPLTIQDEEDQEGTTRGMEHYGYYTGTDFLDLGTGIGLNLSVAKKILGRVIANIPATKNILEQSFMPKAMKRNQEKLIDDRANMLSKV